MSEGSKFETFPPPHYSKFGVECDWNRNTYTIASFWKKIFEKKIFKIGHGGKFDIECASHMTFFHKNGWGFFILLKGIFSRIISRKICRCELPSCLINDLWEEILQKLWKRSLEPRLTRFKNCQNGTKWMIHSKLSTLKLMNHLKPLIHLQYTILEDLYFWVIKISNFLV